MGLLAAEITAGPQDPSGLYKRSPAISARLLRTDRRSGDARKKDTPRQALARWARARKLAGDPIRPSSPGARQRPAFRRHQGDVEERLARGAALGHRGCLQDLCGELPGPESPAPHPAGSQGRRRAGLRQGEARLGRHAPGSPEALSRRTDRKSPRPPRHSHRPGQCPADGLPAHRRLLGRQIGRGRGGGGVGQLSRHLPGDRAGCRSRHGGGDALGAVYGGGAPGHGQSCRGPDHDDGRRHLRLPGRGRLSAGALSAGAAGRGPRCLQRRARLHARLLRRHHLRLPLCHVPGADAGHRPDAGPAADRAGNGHPEFHPRSAFHLRLGSFCRPTA